MSVFVKYFLSDFLTYYYYSHYYYYFQFVWQTVVMRMVWYLLLNRYQIEYLDFLAMPKKKKKKKLLLKMVSENWRQMMKNLKLFETRVL